ncbi:MAG TPA: 50S ribosomal protein L11 methyltransferase [Dongiaceae bacterium]|nr:50S ribosomal protein L11 methyltransferase [Dongiaceae bacterium]
MTRLWSVQLRLGAAAAEAAEAVLEPFAIATSRYEVAGGRLWEVEALIKGAPARRAIRAALAPFGAPSFALVPEKDWLAESRKALRPVTAGRFYLRGSHVRGPTPRGKLALLVDAGVAFGTGRHETTKGCLILLDRLARAGRRFHRILDLGCGSGVLALAAARLWPGLVLGIDNDPAAVRVARENAALNGLADRIRVIRSDGFAAAGLRRAAPFDLVMANILAGPLIRLAPGLARNLAPGGRAILSGLMTDQVSDVLAAYRRQGLVLEFDRHRDDWSVLLLRKPRTRRI